MKTSSLAGLLALGLLAAGGCNRGTPGGPGVTAPTTTAEAQATAESQMPTPTVTNKPIVGEADNTFSLSVPLASMTLKQGEEQSVTIGISRGRNFGEEVAIALVGLPAGVTLVTANPQIKHGDMNTELVLRAADDAALGEFTIKLTGHTATSGTDATSELKLTVAQK